MMSLGDSEEPWLERAGWGQIIAAGINKCWSCQCPHTGQAESKPIHRKLYRKNNTEHSPYLCRSSGCSSLMRLTFVSGSTLLPSVAVSGASPPYISSDIPLSPKHMRTHQVKACISHSDISVIHSLFVTSHSLPWQNSLHASPNACHGQQLQMMS